ncbi:MAG TPA: cysteine--tRNA ligase [Chloroflexota bacterium]
MALRITSTLTGREEEFKPAGEVVTIYACGMTPKFHPHVGHARLFVSMDVIRRYLIYRGYRLHFVQNFTDVDDKIIARGHKEGIDPKEVARKYTDSYFEVMDALNVMRADEYPMATQVIPQIVAFVEKLIATGFAYEVDGNVWYQVDRFAEYGKLSGRSEEEGVMAGARVELEPGKRDPRDFALWKRAKEGEPAWDSPWGPGRPGWHIECSTMIQQTLGQQIDIHAGGRDLIFPHHENEIAQSEAYCGCSPFARYWVHVGLLNIGGEKMSHSLNNFLTIQELLSRYEPAALRLYLISIPYRAPMAYSEEGVEAAVKALGRLRSALEAPTGPSANRDPRQEELTAGVRLAESAQQAFDAAMDSDFNTSQGLAALFDLSRDINRLRIQEGYPAAALEAPRAKLVELAGVLGLDLEVARPRESREADPYIDLLVEVRNKLRAAKQWALADEVRVRLRDLGVSVEDRPEGSIWKYEQP